MAARSAWLVADSAACCCCCSWSAAAAAAAGLSPPHASPSHPRHPLHPPTCARGRPRLHLLQRASGAAGLPSGQRAPGILRASRRLCDQSGALPRRAAAPQAAAPKRSGGGGGRRAEYVGGARWHGCGGAGRVAARAQPGGHASHLQPHGRCQRRHGRQAQQPARQRRRGHGRLRSVGGGRLARALLSAGRTAPGAPRGKPGCQSV